MSSEAEKVKQYLAARPAIIECLRLGIINYSALAREIAPSQPGDATVQAIRRFKQRLKRERSTEVKLARILQKVEVVIRTGLVLYPLHRLLTAAERQRLLELGAASSLTHFQCETRSAVACHTDVERGLPASIKAATEPIRDIVQVTLRHSEEVTKAPGVMARLFGTLAQNDVSVIESVSCTGEQLLYVHAHDLQKVVWLLESGYSSRKASQSR